MKVRVALTEAAQEERLEAARFYRAANLEAAQSFARAFKHELALLKEQPLLGASVPGGHARKVFPHFPYSLIYTFEENLITIYAVAHQSRDPEYWVERVKTYRGG
ncbi:MAG TPA: type II toxin-antitoxin system RelE/ParE family toxin [Longimicrobium sp.]|nr:type II toxin-antitoxin system RelE/ParE family toxin [Longimicrobium sp.]